MSIIDSWNIFIKKIGILFVCFFIEFLKNINLDYRLKFACWKVFNYIYGFGVEISFSFLKVRFS